MATTGVGVLGGVVLIDPVTGLPYGLSDIGGGGAVDSVNGQTGVVVLTAEDIGAATTADIDAVNVVLENKVSDTSPGRFVVISGNGPRTDPETNAAVPSNVRVVWLDVSSVPAAALAGDVVPGLPISIADISGLQSSLDGKVGSTAYRPGVLPMTAGAYFVGASNTSTLVPTEALERAAPVVVGRSCVIDSIGLNVTVAGSAGSVMRLAIRADSNGAPGGVLAEGTVDTTTTGAKALATTVSVVAGQTVWLSATPQGAATTVATVNSCASVPATVVGSTNLAAVCSTVLTGVIAGTTQTGALTASPTFSAVASVPRIALRASA